MGRVVDGKWQKEGRKPDPQGRFVRAETSFRDRITRDGGSAFVAEAGRYHLYVAWACPWAHRTLIMRSLKGLEEAISLSVVDPFMGEMGWEFTGNPDTTLEPFYGKRYLHEVYIQARPDYTGRASVPVLWDKQRETIVNNESREIIRMFDTACDEIAKNPVDFCPEGMEDEIDRTIDAIFEPINNGVYRSGFAISQQAYEEAVTELFAALDHWESVLSRQRYLLGEKITEADWCMFTTLLRFDPVYHFHFKCNLKRLRDYPNLWNYTKELYQYPGVRETCHLDQIKRHYFESHVTVNPAGIVPIGPAHLDFSESHNRDRPYPG